MQDISVLCPKCGGKEIFRALEEKVKGIYLCPQCKTQFGFEGDDRYPLLESVTSVELDIQGFRKESLSIKLPCGKDKRQYKVTKNGTDEYIGDLSSEEWQNLVETLFHQLYLDKWHRNYFDLGIVDGTLWTVTVKFEKKHFLSIHGCNGFPVHWNELLSLFQPYFQKAGIDLMVYRK